MNTVTQKFKNIIKLAFIIFAVHAIQLSASSSNMTHRVMGTSPLLYKMIDYSKHQTSFEIAPIFSSMYDPAHTNSNIILNGKSSLLFDQQGAGDVNPVWLNLMSNNTSADYKSTVTFTPTLTQSGALLHWYDQYDSMFIDIKTALVQCKTEVEINEVGGGNGLNEGILNAQQAFTQSDWNYGKMGASNHVVGLDNVELRIGKVAHCTSEFSSYDMLIAGFGIIEAPTGSGTKAEWLFEPQVGTNHWGLGFGFEALVSGDDDLKFMIAGNYRYLIPAWETRSFDLLGNGQWSRYLLLQDTYGITATTSALPTAGLPGINFLTQQAYINGRSEINLYTRLQKHFQSGYFEVGYNFLCVQRETIGAIKALAPGYGVYALTGLAGGAGGVTTSSTATINQDVTLLDTIGYPNVITTDNFDKISACAAAYATNTVTARLEIHNNKIIYGFGASIEASLSASAISTWSVWAQFGFLFDNIVSCDENHTFSLELYDLEPETATIVHNQINIDQAGLPQDVITSIENAFIDNNDFELDNNNIFENMHGIILPQRVIVPTAMDLSAAHHEIAGETLEMNNSSIADQAMLDAATALAHESQALQNIMANSIENDDEENNISEDIMPIENLAQPAMDEQDSNFEFSDDDAEDMNEINLPVTETLEMDNPSIYESMQHGTTILAHENEAMQNIMANSVENNDEENNMPQDIMPIDNPVQPTMDEDELLKTSDEEHTAELQAPVEGLETNAQSINEAMQNNATISVPMDEEEEEEDITELLVPDQGLEINSPSIDETMQNNAAISAPEDEQMNENELLQSSENQAATESQVPDVDMQMSVNNQTISLENHPIVPQSENGLQLPVNAEHEKEELTIADPVMPEDNQAELMPDQAIKKPLLQTNQSSMSAMTEVDALNKLDSSK